MDQEMALDTSVKRTYFSIQTTGLPKSNDADISWEDTENWPHIVEIAWINARGDNVKNKESSIIQPKGYQIPQSATAIHNITNDRAKKEGKNGKDVLESFLGSLYPGQELVAHNLLRFGLPIIKAEAERYGLPHIILDKVVLVDTGPNFEKFDHLYHKLTGKALKQSHRALPDTEHLMEMHKMGEWEAREPELNTEDSEILPIGFKEYAEAHASMSGCDDVGCDDVGCDGVLDPLMPFDEYNIAHLSLGE